MLKLSIKETQHQDVTILHFKGELDDFNSDAAKTQLNTLIQTGTKKLLLDLSACTFIDSIGLGAVVRAAKKMEDASGFLFLVSNNAQVNRLLKTAGIPTHSHFQIFEDPYSALQALT